MHVYLLGWSKYIFEVATTMKQAPSKRDMREGDMVRGRRDEDEEDVLVTAGTKKERVRTPH